MSEADTIREAIGGASWLTMAEQDEALAALIALERRVEQAEAAFNRLLDDKDAMEGKLTAERDETKGLFEGAMWQVRLHWEEVQRAEARAEQAEALLREWVSPVPTEYPDSLYERTLEALAATTPGESR